MPRKTKLPDLKIQEENVSPEPEIIDEELPPYNDLDETPFQEIQPAKEVKNEPLKEPLKEVKNEPLKEPLKEVKNEPLKEVHLSGIQLKMMTNKKLKELAKSRGMRGYSSMKKSQLLELLGVEDIEMKTHIPESPNVIEPQEVKVVAQSDPVLPEKLELEEEESVSEDIPEEESVSEEVIPEEVIPEEEENVSPEPEIKVIKKQTSKKTKVPRKKKVDVEAKTKKVQENIKTRKQLREEKRQKDYNPFKSYYNIT